MQLGFYLPHTRLLWIFILTMCTFLTCPSWGQIQVIDDTTTTTKSGVQLICDPRLNMLITFKEPAKVSNNTTINNSVISGSIRSRKGFRVLIYAGIDRLKANNTKADFMRKHPGMRIYMTYAIPQYKIKVGDFESRQTATSLYTELSREYSPCMIVPDIVQINTFKKHD